MGGRERSAFYPEPAFPASVSDKLYLGLWFLHSTTTVNLKTPPALVEFGKILLDKQRRKIIWCQTPPRSHLQVNSPSLWAPHASGRLWHPKTQFPIPTAVIQFRYLTKNPWISQILGSLVVGHRTTLILAFDPLWSHRNH